MNERIKKLTEITLSGEMYPQTIAVEYDPEDMFFSSVTMSAKRVCEYILAQEPILHEECAMTGHLIFDGTVEGDIFQRKGHPAFHQALKAFYNRPLHNLVTFEWQHSTANFEEILKDGISGIRKRIDASKQVHEEDGEAIEFLGALSDFCDALIGWAHKCSDKAYELAQSTRTQKYRQNLLLLSESLKKVPEHPAESFYEAVLTVYLCFSFVPDSIGLPDRYLYSYYQKDIKSGTLTEDMAKEYLQELFLMLQSHTPQNLPKFYRGAESHFAIGGYLPNGEDGFNELSRLIVEALMELPTYIPQISLRWTKKTSPEDFRFMMDCERKDPNKRIAFVNDEPKIKAFTEYLGMSYEDAVNYTMVGCNEVAFPGGIYMGSAQENIVRSLARTLHERGDDLQSCLSFDDFYQIYEKELFADLGEMLYYEDKFNLLRARDVNIVSSIFFKGCVERAKSVTQGGATVACSGIDLIGIPNVIDSLAIVKQFVYDEQIFSMRELLEALRDNWQEHEDLLTLIRKKGNFFGNDNDTSNEVARRFTGSLYHYLNDKRSLFGHKYLVGNLIGYNEHHKWFGEKTPATPDGRRNGEPFKFGLGQSGGYDREGLSALLNSVAKCDPNHILNGPTVTNVTIDEQLVKNNEHFEKTVHLFESYLQSGGIHFQLTYVSKEDLLRAQETPDSYKHLRVRVSGFSDYFVLLNRALQDDVIARTTQTR